MADREKALIKAHEKKFKSVSDMKARVELVRQYSDHSDGMLEVLKVVSDCLPEGTTLTSFTYKRGESVKISGEAAAENSVYDYKDELSKSGMFPKIELTGPTAVRDRLDRTRTVQKFDITASFEEEETE
jgi:Tfp pilus assembly protein PilN